LNMNFFSCVDGVADLSRRGRPPIVGALWLVVASRVSCVC
jgi:hypothetical protein